ANWTEAWNMAGPVFTPRVIREGPGGLSPKATSKDPTLETSVPRWPSISPLATTVVSCGFSVLSAVLQAALTEVATGRSRVLIQAATTPSLQPRDPAMPGYRFLVTAYTARPTGQAGSSSLDRD